MAADGGDDDVFVYLGGEQVVPDEITHAIIDPSVNIVRRRAFYRRRRLVSVIFHDDVEIIEWEAFNECKSLSGRIKLLGVREIEGSVFSHCYALSDVEFGDRLETVGNGAFFACSLRSIKIPSVRTVEFQAFNHCEQLTDVEFGINLRTIVPFSFYGCTNLQRIAIPLKDGLFPDHPDGQRFSQFGSCDNLTTVDLVGAEGVRKTISSLLLKSWRKRMNQEINRINQVLPSIYDGEDKAEMIRLCTRSVIDRLEHYKAEHNRLLKEHMTLLELAIWKAKLDENEDNSTLKAQTAKRAKIDVGNARKEKRITSGADIIIKNVLPFLQLME